MFRHLIAGQGLVPDGESVFTESGDFVVPDNVTQISAVLVGGGGSGGGGRASAREGGDGGSLVWATIPVTPGETLSITVGAAAIEAASAFAEGNHGEASVISRAGSPILRAVGGSGGGATNPDTNLVDSSAIVSGEHSGGAGGASGSQGRGGGGAAGYSGNGGAAGLSGSGGGGGGGASAGTVVGGLGGGVGLNGEGASGAGGFGTVTATTGSPGGNGSDGSYGRGGPASADGLSSTPGTGSNGAVRIVYPGQLRRFPTTNVGA